MNFKYVWTLVCCVVALSIAGMAHATSTIEVEWTFSAEDQAGITMFRIYDMNNQVVVDNIPAAARIASFETSDICNSWYLKAIAGGEENEVPSDHSTAAPWCPEPPETPITPVPGTFHITGSVTINPAQ